MQINYTQQNITYDASSVLEADQYSILLGDYNTVAEGSTQTQDGGIAIASINSPSGYPVSATAHLSYQFSFSGPSNTEIPIIVNMNDYVIFSNGAPGGEGEAYTNLSLSNGDNVTNLACAGSNLCYYVYKPGNYPLVTGQYKGYIESDTLNTVSLYAYASNFYIGGYGTTASADPTVQIDPSFANAAEFNLVESPGISNSIAGAAPEPASWALMLVGLGGLGMALRTRSRRKFGMIAASL